MAQKNINIGSAYGDPSADKRRDAFSKCEDNFTEIYTGDFTETLTGNLMGGVSMPITTTSIVPSSGQLQINTTSALYKIRNYSVESETVSQLFSLDGDMINGTSAFLLKSAGPQVTIVHGTYIKTRTGSNLVLTDGVVFGFINVDGVFYQIF
jgi:hypothetical protein